QRVFKGKRRHQTVFLRRLNLLRPWYDHRGQNHGSCKQTCQQILSLHNLFPFFTDRFSGNLPGAVKTAPGFPQNLLCLSHYLTAFLRFRTASTAAHPAASVRAAAAGITLLVSPVAAEDPPPWAPPGVPLVPGVPEGFWVPVGFWVGVPVGSPVGS